MLRKRSFLAAAIVALGAVFASPVVAQATPFPLTAVPIGDSFITGEGGIETGPYLEGSDTPANRCHRSVSSPVRLLASIKLVKVSADPSCSGAVTTNITTAGQYNEPPQVAGIPSDVKRVYVSIGGNDIGFGMVLGCYILSDCEQTTVPQQTLNLIEQLEPKLDDTYDAIRAAAPTARIVVLLYANVLPPVGSKVGPGSGCPWVNSQELVLGNQIQDGLNGAVRRQARLHGFRVVNPNPTFAGHSICADDPWLYPPGTVPQAATAHPTFKGRAASAGSLLVASL